MKEPAHSLDELLFLLGRRPFVLWMIGQALLVSTIVVGARILKTLSPRAVNATRIRLARGIAYGSVSLDFDSKQDKNAHQFLSGILSAHSLLVAKTAVELLVRTVIDRKNQFNRWQSWMILIGLVALALSQLYYLHCGLKLCSTSILYPLVFCIYNIVAIMDGLLYFRQTSKLSVLHALLIAVGTVILLSGVLALSWRLSGEPTQPPVAPSALVPGMGFVDEASEDDEDIDYGSDEERGIGGEGEALLQKDALTPTTKYDKLLSATRLQRRGMTEADEIWGELEDNAARYPAPLPRRSISGISTLSRPRRNEDDPPHETTSLLRSVTGRSSRSRRKRIGSLHVRRPSEEQPPQRGSPKDTKPQSALGGWWRMEWWKGRKGRTTVPASDEAPDSES
ncbi:hypothetical protein GP486_002392 [Trichoglossum hirsutum]|uniref:DUF803 domain-containing protein n=1 Tax=Trichoglossum hirsutum TaxID=265104 RepID=A0A9P8RRR6_9PEZI|nr:hypothetical protein GP486_002392 [Trichoglossum hirsutum]